MKGSVSRADTRRVLAAVDAVVRDVRTAAAVDRVLETATPSICGAGPQGHEFTKILCDELGIKPAGIGHYATCQCDDAQIPRDGLGGLLVVITGACPDGYDCRLHGSLAPWAVSPRLFDRGEK